MVCPRCGATLPEGTNFCPVCGSNLNASARTNSGQPGWQQPGYSQSNYQQPGWQQSGYPQNNNQQPGWRQSSYQQPGWQTPQPGYQYGQNQRPYAANMPMSWYKFLIYFALWAGGILNILGSVNYFSSPALLNILYGLVCVAAGAFAIYTRYRLAQFRTDGPMCLYITYGIQGAAPLAYAVLFALFYYPSSSLFASAIGAVVGSGIMVALNHIYFQKRARLFVN